MRWEKPILATGLVEEMNGVIHLQKETETMEKGCRHSLFFYE